MCIYSGASYLQELLYSIGSQKYRNWHVYVSYDGWHDSTQAILQAFQAKTKRFRISGDPKRRAPKLPISGLQSFN